jgi:hypothetical protein
VAGAQRGAAEQRRLFVGKQGRIAPQLFRPQLSPAHLLYLCALRGKAFSHPESVRTPDPT